MLHIPKSLLTDVISVFVYCKKENNYLMSNRFNFVARKYFKKGMFSVFCG